MALDVVEQFNTYEEYLDSQVTDTDMYFLEVTRPSMPYSSNSSNTTTAATKCS